MRGFFPHIEGSRFEFGYLLSLYTLAALIYTTIQIVAHFT